MISEEAPRGPFRFVDGRRSVLEPVIAGRSRQCVSMDACIQCWLMQPRPLASTILLLAALAPLALAPVASAQQIAAASESTITVSGAGIEGETYHLAQVYGDWFATATEATARLTMRTVPGPHQAQLGISWDGKGMTQT